MADKRVWFITGAGRGMGVDIAQAALSAGRAVVATGRSTEAVADAVGEADDLLVVKLDITSLASAEAAVQAAVDRFGRIDVLVNNAGNFYAGFLGVGSGENGPQLPHRHVECPEPADHLGSGDLFVRVVPVAAVRVDLARLEQPNLVVVAQRLHAQVRGRRECAD
jgi:NAD(P)-dependent dehydrogenase (short-subunit alcohol dehydrogenase family)